MSAVGLFLLAKSNREGDQLLAPIQRRAVVGTSPTADVQISDTSCAGFHLLIELDEQNQETGVLIDLGSHYGTFFKQQRVREVRIKMGEKFRIGSQDLALRPISDTAKSLHPKSSQLPLPPLEKVSQKNLVTSNTLLQVRLYWGETPLEVATFGPGSDITIGPQMNAVFDVPFRQQGKGDKSFTIGRYDSSGLKLFIPISVHGLLWIGKDTIAVDSLRHTDKNNKEFGDTTISLRVGDRAHLEFDELSLEFEFVSPPSKLKIWSLDENDRFLLRLGLSLVVLIVMGVTGILFRTPPPEEVKTLKDLPANLQKVVFDAGIAEALKQQRAAIGEIAANLEGGRAKGEEGQSTATKSPNPEKSKPTPVQKNNTIIVKNAPKASSKNIKAIESAFTSNSQTKLTTPSVVGPQTTGNTVSALTGGTFARGTKGFGAGGGGQSVGIGQLKGMSRGGGMGAGDYGLAPSKGRPIEGRVIEDIEIQGGLDPEIIAAIIRRYLPQIRHCYEQQLTASPKLSGKVKAKFTINGEGDISTASVLESTLNNTPTENCIVGKIKKWKFPKPKGGGTVDVKYPFLLMSNSKN